MLETRIPERTTAAEPEPEPRALEIVNAARIQETAYLDPIFVIERVLPKGLTILAGKPHVGKRHLALELAVAVSSGRDALGRFHVTEPGKVLYMALDENERSISRRLAALNPGGIFPDIEFIFDLPEKLGNGDDTQLGQHLKQNRGKYALIVVSPMLAAFDPSSQRNLLKVVTEKSAILRRLASEYEAAIVAVHPAKAPLGVSENADSILILDDKKGQKLLTIQSRDTEEEELTIKVDSQQGGWMVVGSTREVGKRRRAGELETLTLLSEKGPLKPKQIAEALGAAKGKSVESMRVYRLIKAGVLRVLRNRAVWPVDQLLPAGYDDSPGLRVRRT
jgi:hypothetical protein